MKPDPIRVRVALSCVARGSFNPPREGELTLGEALALDLVCALDALARSMRGCRS